MSYIKDEVIWSYTIIPTTVEVHRTPFFDKKANQEIYNILEVEHRQDGTTILSNSQYVGTWEDAICAGKQKVREIHEEQRKQQEITS